MAAVAAGALGVAAPAFGQNVTVLNGQTFTVTVPTTINSLNINPGGTVDIQPIGSNDNALVVNDNGVDTVWSGTIHGVNGTSGNPTTYLLKTGTGTVTFANLTADGGELHINGGKAILTEGESSIRYLTIGSDAGNGSFDMSGGVLNILGPILPCNCNPAMQVGDFGGIGVVNQIGGTINFDTAAFNIGNQGGNGTYNLSGGSIVVTGASGVTIGRTPNPARNSTGLLNISGTGLFDMRDGVFVIGNNNPGGGSQTTGTVTQTGGTFRVDNDADLFLQGYNHGVYNLNGGTLEIGGTSLHGERYVFTLANTTGSYEFNLGGGTIKVIESALITNADAKLVGGTTSTIDTNGLGAAWNGFLSGEGNLKKAGDGTLLLTKVNTYSGLTTIADGTLKLDTLGDIAASSGVHLSGADATFDITTGSKQIKDLSGVAGSFVALGASTLTAGTTNDTEFAGAIQGTGGLTKVGGGVLTLSGMNTYTGATAITNGTLKMGIADAIAGSTSVTVANNARWDLGGAGTQHVDGPVSFAGGGILSLDLGAGDNIIADGVGTGGKIDIRGGDGSFDPMVPYVFLDGTGAAVGTFLIVGNDMPLLTPTANTVGDVFNLTFAKSGQTLAFLADTPNTMAVGGALDSLPLTNSLYKQIATLGEPAIQIALNSMTGEFHASTKSALVEQAEYVPEAVGDRINTALGDVPGGGGADLSADDAIASLSSAHGAGIWAQAYGRTLELDGDSANVADLSGTGAGVVGGVDYRAGDWIVGIGAGYSVSELESNEVSSDGDVESYHALAYAGGDIGMVRLQVGGAYSWGDVDTTRTVILPDPQTLVASYSAETAQVFGEASVQFGALRPFAGASYINVSSEGFTETGGDAALTAASSEQNVTFTTLGMRAELNGGGMLVARGMVGWRHAFGDVDPLSSFAIQGNAFTVSGVPIAEDAFVTEAGVDVLLSDAFSIGVSYAGQIASDAQEHGARATATVNF